MDNSENGFGPKKPNGETGSVYNQQKQQVEVQTNINEQTNINVQITNISDASRKALRESYLNRVFQQTCDLQLSGIDPKVATAGACRKMQLSAVYTGLLTRQPEVDAEQLAGRKRPEPEKPSRLLSALALLNREKHLALLGDPGSGKSTFVNFVALCLAGEGLGIASANIDLLTAPLPANEDKNDVDKPEKKSQPWDHRDLLPVRIVLRDLAARGLPEPGSAAGRDTLWKFVEAELGANLKEFAGHMLSELQEKGGLILLDGLDEVPDALNRRLQVKQAVKGFVEDFPKCRVLATSRTYAYQKQEWKLGGFAEAVLSPFSPKQIAHFVERWYEHVGVVRSLNADEAKGRASLLNAAIERSERLSELAARPLLLTLMASLHAWRGGSLPEKREQLYADAVELLLDQWESPKVVRDALGQPIVEQSSIAEWLKVDKAVVRAELNRLAFEAHRDQPNLTGTADISEERLVAGLMRIARNKDVNPVKIEAYIRERAGLLDERGAGVYTFPHRTFQEYLAACHLTDFGFPDEAAELLRSGSQRWREAVLLAGAKAARGTAAAAWYLAEALCFRDPPANAAGQIEKDCWGALLAAQTLLENERDRLGQVSERNAPKLERIRRWLLLIVSQGLLPPVDRALAGEALSVFGDERDFEELVAVAAGNFLMGDEGDEDASPQHEVHLPGFRIGRYPVTNAQYRAFVDATGREWRYPSGLRPESLNCPAVYVDWDDARAFCEWLTVEWRQNGRVSANEIVRLTTEAEWEKAARGSDGRTFPWGSDWKGNHCNSRDSEIGRPSAVGMFPAGASPYACLDMAGNVWEWTSSLWGKGWEKPDFKYPYRSDDGRESLKAEGLRVLRGGSWLDYRGFARCSYRYWGGPDDRGGFIGFRVVVSPIPFPSAP
jgi:formylglycine-generating enzyme required for sulfatase activity